MDRNDTVQYCFRLNLRNPDHLLVHRTLMNLDLELYKSKSTFIIDSLVKYIKGITPEVLIGDFRDKDFVTRTELEELKENMKKSVTEDVTKNMYSILVTALTNGSVMNNSNDYSSDTDN